MERLTQRHSPVKQYAEHDIVIINTLFRQKSMYKTTWMHPRSKYWHLLDYVIVPVTKKDVRITRTMRGTGAFPTDHRLVRSLMNIRLDSKYREQKKKRTRRNTTSNPSSSQTPIISLLMF